MDENSAAEATRLMVGPPGEQIHDFNQEAIAMADERRFPISATKEMSKMLTATGVQHQVVGKASREAASAIDVLDGGRVDLVINARPEHVRPVRPDGYHIRRRVMEIGAPLITILQLAKAMIEAMWRSNTSDLQISALTSYS